MFVCANGRRMKEKKDMVEPEADPERDQRTVFAYQVDSFSCFFLPFMFSLYFAYHFYYPLYSLCRCL